MVPVTAVNDLGLVFLHLAQAPKPKKPAKEIPVPEVRMVETFYRDYLPVFVVPNTYIRGKGIVVSVLIWVELCGRLLNCCEYLTTSQHRVHSVTCHSDCVLRKPTCLQLYVIH